MRVDIYEIVYSHRSVLECSEKGQSFDVAIDWDGADGYAGTRAGCAKGG